MHDLLRLGLGLGLVLGLRFNVKVKIKKLRLRFNRLSIMTKIKRLGSKLSEIKDED